VGRRRAEPGDGGAGGEETGISLPLAAKIRDWQTLLFAVEDMIADQHDFVAWWDANVTLGQSPGTNQWSVADRQPTISAEDVTALTGIQKWQVSRWRTAGRLQGRPIRLPRAAGAPRTSSYLAAPQGPTSQY